MPRRLHILPWSLAVLILALLLGATPLLAQQTSGSPPPKQGSVKPMGICNPDVDPDCAGDTYAPGVAITPAGGTLAAPTLVVTIDWWDDNTLDDATRSITLNGSSVTSSFSYTSSGAGSATSTGTITLQLGSNTLTAQIRDRAGNLGSRMAILNFPGVGVTPDGQAVTVRLSSPQTYDFTVRNTATGSATYNLTAQCSNAVSGCAVTNPVSPITVGAGQQKTVTVSYQSGAANTTGRVTLRAANAANAALVDTGWINVTSVHAYSVAVTPQSAATTLAAYTPSSYVFTVQNTGSTSTTFDLAATCTGATTGCSTGGVTTLTLASQATQTVKVDYQAGAGSSTGSVTLRATMRGDASVTSAGTLSVTTTWPKYLTVNTGFTNTDNQNLGLCASDCFAPVYAHSSVPYFSLGAARSATLIYHGERTAVRPIVAAEVTLAAGAPRPQELTLEARVNGAAVTFTNGDRVLHFKSDAGALPAGDTLPRRLAGQLNASTYATGMYPLELVVTAVYADHQEVTSVSTKLMVVNLRTPDLLPVQGWTVAGVQRLLVQADGTVLIVEGDGSGVYFGCTSYTVRCSGPAGDFSTLQATNSGSSLIYTRAYPDSTKAIFNNLGQMTRVVDRWGNATDFEYPGGKLSKILDPVLTYGGKRAAIEFWYGAGSFTLATPGPKGDSASAARRKTVVTYDASGRVTAFSDPDSVSTSLGYDASGRLATITDRRGSTTTYTYDPVTWKLTRTELPQIPVDVGGGATQMQAPALRFRAGQTVGVPTTSTSATMLASPVRVDTAWAIVVGADGDTTRFTVDRWGQPLVIKDALANATTIARTGIFATAVTNPLGQTDRYSYTGPFLKRVEPHGQPATTISYDTWGMVSSVSGGGGPTRTATYSASNPRTITEKIDGGYATVRYLDARGRDTLITDPASHKTRFGYDSTFGNLQRTTAAAGQWTQVTYDGYGRDSLTSVSGRPKAAMRLYDLLNRVTATYDTVGATPMRFTYDKLFLTTVRDPKGQVYRTDVNALGWPTKVYDPADTVSWARYQSYGYSPGGQVKSARNREGRWTYLQYDVLGRMTSRRDPLAPADSFRYSPNGRIVVGSNSLSIDSVFVGDAGADSVVTRFVGDTLRFARRHSATASTTADTTTITTNVTGLTFSPRRYHWSPNRGVLDSIVVGTTAVRFSYNGELQRAATIYPDYVRTEDGTTTHLDYGYSFDSALLDSAFRREYQRDSLGRIASEARLLRYYERPYGDSLGTAYEVRNYRYNGAGALGSYERIRSQDRVCNREWGCIPGGVFPFQTYGYPEYDGARNLLAQVDSTSSAKTRITGIFATGNRLTSWAGASYTYDLDGNRATRLSGGVTTTYTWSATGQLLSVQQGSTTVAYGYNAFGELARRQMNGQTDRYFLWDEGQLLAELDGTAKQKLNEYAYRPGTDQPLALLSGGSSTLRFFQTDGRGDVIGLSEGIDDVQQLVYSPWGEREIERGPVLLGESRLGWKGLMWEGGVTNLYYVRARWYDPATRSFISEDPIGLAGGVNTYAFAGNDPVNGRDPSGLHPLATVYTWAGIGTDADFWSMLIFSSFLSGAGDGGGGAADLSGLEERIHGGGGGGGSWKRADAQPKPNLCRDQKTETQVTGGMSALAGLGAPGAFFGGGFNFGVTSSGRMFIQFQGSITGGVGAFLGWGAGGGVSRSAVTPKGISTGGAWMAQANAGLGLAAGGSVTRDDAGHWGLGRSLLGRVGTGWGAQASVGRVESLTIAWGDSRIIRRLFNNKCR